MAISRREVDHAAAVGRGGFELGHCFAAQLVESFGAERDVRRLEPVVRQPSVVGVVRLVHVDERADLHRLLRGQLDAGVVGEHRDRLVREQLRRAFDLHHLVVTDDDPDRPEAVHLHEVDRATFVQRQGLFSPCLHVAVPMRIMEDVSHHAAILADVPQPGPTEHTGCQPATAMALVTTGRLMSIASKSTLPPSRGTP